MIPLLRAELIKLRTTRTFLALTGVAVGLGLLLTVLTASIGDTSESSVLVDVFASDTSSLFILILAIIGMSGEWRHRTITSSLLAAPDRIRFLAAKMLAFAIAGVVMSLAISASIAVSAYPILELRDQATPALGEVLKLDAKNALVSFMLGALGVGIGGLLRNQAIAIVTVLIVILIVEPVLLGVANDVGRFGPLNALPTAIIDFDPEAVGLGDVKLLDQGAAAVALTAWIGVFFAAAGILLKKRDLD